MIDFTSLDLTMVLTYTIAFIAGAGAVLWVLRPYVLAFHWMMTVTITLLHTVDQLDYQRTANRLERDGPWRHGDGSDV